MIPLTLALVAGAVAAFFWAVDHDQFDDLDTSSLLPLEDDPRAWSGGLTPANCRGAPPEAGSSAR